VYPRVLVAADQLDQARAIAAQPIPQDIVDDSKTGAPEYEVPKCPKCGAEDPILESVEQANHWRCEQCEVEWTEPAEVTDGQAGKSENSMP
jgi:ribosomal protein L37AE/L43A